MAPIPEKDNVTPAGIGDEAPEDRPPDPLRFLTPQMRALLDELQGRAPPGAKPVRFYPFSNDERVGHWLERAYHAHQFLMREALAELGLTPAQASLLLDVSQREHAQTHDHLARRLRVSRSVITRTLHRLECAGLVRMTTNAANRRQSHVELSDAGKAVVERLGEELERTDQELMGRLRPSARRWLTLLLPRLEDAARRAAWARRAGIPEKDVGAALARERPAASWPRARI